MLTAPIQRYDNCFSQTEAKLFMTKLFLVGLTVFCFLNPVTTLADTVDVWTVKINGKAIINSNQTDILYFKHPMKIKLPSFADNDTLQICYWTDSGLERYKWYYIFKNASNLILYKFTNPIDSSSHTKSIDRKNYISFCIRDLKQIMKNKSVNKIFVEFEQDNSNLSKEYSHKTICTISKD